jgi:peptidoglycan/LPS O-acetylase OafA/YrhL
MSSPEVLRRIRAMVIEPMTSGWDRPLDALDQESSSASLIHLSGVARRPLSYRADIDGLRGVAVLAIVLFHSSSSALPGGYLGVDIFFVISGFVITQLLSAPSDLPWRARLATFYFRRARRILPALFTTSVIAVVAGMIIYLPADLIRLGKYLFFTPFALANLASALDGGYFGAGGAFTALKHYWSLAVEEQFYLVYPLLFAPLVIRGEPRRQIWVLIAAAAVAAAFGIRGELRHSVATFYLMPARALELILGALAAVSPVRWAFGRLATGITSSVCLAAVIASFFIFDETISFPHPYVLIPCAATAVVLLIGSDRSAGASRLLAAQPLVFTGKISYSLYLWHAVVLAFARYYAIRSLSIGELAISWAGIYLLAMLSWRFVEKPIRYKDVLPHERTFVLTSIAGGITLALIGAFIWWSDGWPERFPRDLQALVTPDTLPPLAERCMNLPLERIAAGNLCRVRPEHPGIKTAVLWGDSHALVLVPALEALAKSHDLQIQFAGRSSCRPVRSLVERSSRSVKELECSAFNEAMIAAIGRIRPTVTLITGFWAQELALAEEGPVSSSFKAESPGWNWDQTLSPIRAAGSSVCVILDVPYLHYTVPYALAMARRRGIDTSFLYEQRTDVLARYAQFETSARAQELTRAVEVVDPKDVLCSGARCELETNGRSLYRDSNHLSRAGAMQIKRSLDSCFQ